VTHDYELLVIGSGPGGQRAAIQAAKLGRRAAVIERYRSREGNHALGGSCVNTGTIPSKAVREAIVSAMTTARQREGAGLLPTRQDVSAESLRRLAEPVVERERAVVRDQLVRNHVAVIQGTARFVDPHTVAAVDPQGGVLHVSGERIVIATGSRPSRPAGVAFDDERVVDSDGLLRLGHIPDSILVVGAGVIGMEYASILAALRARVTVVDGRPGMLDFCDAEITDALRYELRDLGVVFRFGEEVVGVETREGGTITHLASGKHIATDAVLYSTGRRGDTDELDLERAGLEADDRGRIPVDERYRTSVEHIWAVGDVIGFPALAATSAEQGRIAAANALGFDVRGMPALHPIGIYTIPEISYVGETEAALMREGIAYEVGIARYRELARGQLLGETHGLLKLLAGVEDRRLLGVHAIGTGATELVHIGQAVLAHGGTVDYLVDTVFNYPTLAEAYKVAALDISNRLAAVARLSATP